MLFILRLNITEQKVAAPFFSFWNVLIRIPVQLQQQKEGNES